MTASAISVFGLNFSYETNPLLQSVHFEIQPGSFVGVIGPNGGGKTTLFKLLLGFLKPTSGHIQIFGQSPLQARKRLGYVPQSHRTDRDFPITVWQIVLLGALAQTSIFGVYPPKIKEKARSLIEQFGLSDQIDRPFSSLSGGLAQRALLARALLSDPDLLLLDEPTANIDAPSRAFILNLLQMLKGKKTILLVTHDLKTVVERVDQVLCVQGQVTSYRPQEICEHFALGLYHTPLADLPDNHFQKKVESP